MFFNEEMTAIIDTVGDSFVEMNIKEFPRWFEAHRSDIGKMNMKTLNHKIHWIDEIDNKKAQFGVSLLSTPFCAFLTF